MLSSTCCTDLVIRIFSTSLQFGTEDMYTASSTETDKVGANDVKSNDPSGQYICRYSVQQGFPLLDQYMATLERNGDVLHGLG